MSGLAQQQQETSAGQRWLARGSVCLFAAVVVLVLAAAGTQTWRLLALVALQAVLVVVGLWLALAHRSWARAGGLALAAAAVIGALAVEAAHGLIWVVAGAVVLLAAAVWLGEQALRPAEVPEAVPEAAAEPPRHPFLIMNPRSGGGKVERFELVDRARRLGAEVALLEGPGQVDVAELARRAVGDGADLLGVAGGDGTQALVAGVAAAAGVPLLVIPAGTRNHFALDLGLDRDDPSTSLSALTDGTDVAIDLGDVDGRPFVNNVSFGAYATIVAQPGYRENKRGTTLDTLPDLLSGHEGPTLTVEANGESAVGPQAALVSNNPYGTGEIGQMGRRARIDTGRLGLALIRVGNALQAADLLRGRRSAGIDVLTTEEVVVASDTGEVPVGIDGESLVLPSPVHCSIRPRALTVRLPRTRPGPAVARPPFSLKRVAALVVPHPRHEPPAHGDPQ
jgi:diacylglycerol kinase family enzyme